MTRRLQPWVYDASGVEIPYVLRSRRRVDKANSNWLDKAEADKASVDSADSFLAYQNGGGPTMGMRWFGQPERL